MRLAILQGNFAGGLFTAAAGVVPDAGTAVTEYPESGSGVRFQLFPCPILLESDTQGVRHVKVADVARSAAQAAMEAAQAAQQIAYRRTGSGVETPTVLPPSQPAYADRPRSADSSAGRSSADTVIAAAARAGYSRLGAAARDSAVAANPAAGQPASTQLRAQTDHCGDFACRRPDYRGGALMMWMICLFGGLGAMARYVLDVNSTRLEPSENRRTNCNFPLSTLVINGVASYARASP